MSKALKNAFPSLGVNGGGYLLTPAMAGATAAKLVDMGTTAVTIDSGGFAQGDYLGRLRATWYINMKDKRS